MIQEFNVLSKTSTEQLLQAYEFRPSTCCARQRPMYTRQLTSIIRKITVPSNTYASLPWFFLFGSYPNLQARTDKRTSVKNDILLHIHLQFRTHKKGKYNTTFHTPPYKKTPNTNAPSPPMPCPQSCSDPPPSHAYRSKNTLRQSWHRSRRASRVV